MSSLAAIASKNTIKIGPSMLLISMLLISGIFHSQCPNDKPLFSPFSGLHFHTLFYLFPSSYQGIVLSVLSFAYNRLLWANFILTVRLDNFTRPRWIFDSPDLKNRMKTRLNGWIKWVIDNWVMDRIGFGWWSTWPITWPITYVTHTHTHTHIHTHTHTHTHISVSYTHLTLPTKRIV